MAFIIDDIINAITGAQAAQQQQQQIQAAMGQQQGIYNQSRSDQSPYMAAGQTSLADLMKLQSDPSAIQASPAYQFQLAQGQQALQRSAAAKGGLMGGGFAKSLAQYSQGLASNEYQNQWNRLYQTAGMGQNSAQNLGSLGANFANSMSQLYGAKGNAQAAGTMAIGNGIAGAVKDAGTIGLTAATGGLGGLAMGGGAGGGLGSLLGMGGQSTGYASNYMPRQGLMSGLTFPTQGG
jgi:hypothetical protein